MKLHKELKKSQFTSKNPLPIIVISLFDKTMLWFIELLNKLTLTTIINSHLSNYASKFTVVYIRLIQCFSSNVILCKCLPLKVL